MFDEMFANRGRWNGLFGAALVAAMAVTVTIAVSLGSTSRCMGQEGSPAASGRKEAAVDGTEQETLPVGRPEILRRQEKLAAQYQLLEEKLFTLYRFELDKNPARAKLLERAFQRSQTSATAEQLREIAATIGEARLKQAEGSQEAVLEQLQGMLALLQSEDRSKRLKDEIERYQEYLKEVEKLLRIQKGLRGQTEGGRDPQRIAAEQAQAAERTENLSGEIRNNEEAVEDEGEGKPDAAKPDAPSSSQAESDSEAQPGGDSNGESSQAGESKPPVDPEANPVRKTMDAAAKRMRQAQQKLQEAQRDEATDQMRAAEKEIAKAKRELEEVLRQMREEEIERTLANLEERFRKMLKREIKLKQSTQKMAAIDPEDRDADFDRETGKLSAEQNVIATDASRAYLLLSEDGTSVAFLETVSEMQQDMTRVAARLSTARVDEFTTDLQAEIIETLNDLVAALAQAQRDQEKQKEQENQPQQGGGASPSGEEPLVGQIAELKMLRSLQQRIFRRHQRYSKQLASPDDPIGYSDEPEMVAALRRLTQKQQKLAQMTKDAVQEMEKQQ